MENATRRSDILYSIPKVNFLENARQKSMTGGARERNGEKRGREKEREALCICPR